MAGYSTLPSIFIVTGYSGAGKSTVLRALEDFGFFCVDNLPLPLLSSFFQAASQGTMHHQKIALGLDVRAGDMHMLAQELIILKKSSSYQAKTIFLHASSAILLKRFQETRRKHPLPQLDLVEAIEQEKKLLEPLALSADITIDTDFFTIHELRNCIKKLLGPSHQQVMLVSLISFGFKYGVPHESNFIYDLRSLPNPYFVPEFKLLDGLNSKVHDYLFEHQEVQEFWKRLFDFFRFCLDRSYQEGRFFMHIGLGCTGGRHRSVAFVQELAKQSIEHVEFLVKHRDINKDYQL